MPWSASVRKTLLPLLFLLLAHGAARAEAPPVLVSVKPLHSLVAMVMEGVGRPGLIIEGPVSPHGYALKPSDARAIQAARLVVWVGPAFEPWLTHAMAEGRENLALLSLPGLIRLDAREGGAWEPHHHGHEEHAAGAADETDPHAWLDPRNAMLLVEAVAERLSALDPEHAARYGANALAARRRLEGLDAELAARLAPLANRPYVVFHDAHQYFERRYGLDPAGAITVDPERPPGARRMAQLRDRLKEAKAACVFAEPGTSRAAARALADAAGARLGQLDPEGLLAAPGPDSYVQQMRALADSLAQCLSPR
jgi:zinc transport system substrate-binding protein